MTKQILNVLNSNIDFIQLKLFDFSDEKIDQEKIISERLNKSSKIENTNQKLFLDENNTFKYDNPICPVCGSHKIIKKGTMVVCALIDWIRELLFRKLKVKERFGKFEENVYLKFDNYLNSNS